MISEQERPILTDEQLVLISKDDLIHKWRQLERYANDLEARCEQTIQENKKKLNQIEIAKSFEIAKLKNIILMKYVSSKEQESTVSLYKFYFFVNHIKFNVKISN